MEKSRRDAVDDDSLLTCKFAQRSLDEGAEQSIFIRCFLRPVSSLLFGVSENGNIYISEFVLPVENF